MKLWGIFLSSCDVLLRLSIGSHCCEQQPTLIQFSASRTPVNVGLPSFIILQVTCSAAREYIASPPMERSSNISPDANARQKDLDRSPDACVDRLSAHHRDARRGETRIIYIGSPDSTWTLKTRTHLAIALYWTRDPERLLSQQRPARLAFWTCLDGFARTYTDGCSRWDTRSIFSKTLDLG